MAEPRVAPSPVFPRQASYLFLGFGFMIGKTLDHYEILEKLGGGGMGEVYRARDTKLNRDVALKVLPIEMAKDPERRRRFEREAQAVAALQHPNIVTIFAVEESDGQHFITMELVDGMTLDEAIPPNGFGLDRFLDLAIPLADAIAAAHDKGITHRDLKPANVMVGKDGRVRVLDFGLAKLVEAPIVDSTPDGDTLAAPSSSTQIGQVLGTAAYMSPEQAEGREVDHRSDIFSLGILLYQMATGEPPFRGDSSLSVMSSVLRDSPATVTEIKRSLPNQLGRIVEHCMAKDPKRRFQSTLDVRNELESLQTEVGSKTAHEAAAIVGKPVVRSSRKTGVAVGAAIIILGLVAVMILRPGGGGGDTVRGGSELQAESHANSLAIFPFENLADPEDPQRLGQILQELVITDLSGVQAMKVFSSQRLTDVQKQIGREGQSASEPGLAAAVAEEAGASTILTGRLSQLGERYILTGQLIDAKDGTIIQSKRIDGSDLYTMVDQLSDEIHRDLQLGEVSELAQKPLAQKTSTSLDAYRYYLDGVEHLNNNRYPEAVEELKRAVEIDPNFGQAYYRLAIATWWAENDPGAGTEHIDYLLANHLYSTEREKHTAEAMAEVINTHYAAALPLLEQLTTEDPDDKEAWYGLGEAQYHFPGGGKQHESLASFQRAIALDPDFQLAYAHLYSQLWEESRMDEAMELVQQNIQRAPDEPLAYRWNAFFSLVQAEHPSDATEAIDQAIEVHRSPADQRELFKYLGQASQIRGDSELRESYAKRALEADPGHDDQVLVGELLNILSEQRKWGEYEEQVRQELARNPGDDDLRGRILGLHVLRREHVEALAMAKEYVRQKPDSRRWNERWVQTAIYAHDGPEVVQAVDTALGGLSPDERRDFLQTVAFYYQGCGNLSAAGDYFQQALSVDTANEYPQLIGALGFVEFRLGNLSAAEAGWQKTLRIDPRNVNAHFGMFAIETERGNTDAAWRHLETGRDLIPVRWVDPYFNAMGAIYANDANAANEAIREIKTQSPTRQWSFLDDRNISPGYMYLIASKPQEAIAIFEYMATLDISRRDPEAHVGLGLSQLQAGDYDQAITTFRSGLDSGYPRDDILRGLTMAYLLNGDVAAAERSAERLKTEARYDVDNIALLAYVRAEQGRYTAARELAETVVDLRPDREGHELLAWVLVAGDVDLDRGAKVAEAAAASPILKTFDFTWRLPYRAPAEHSLGLAAFKRGEYETAVNYLQTAAERVPDRAPLQADLDRARAEARKTP